MRILIFIFFIFLSSVLHTQENDWKREITPFSNLGKDAMRSVSGYNSLFHIGGIAATYVLIKSNIDYNVHNYFSQNIHIYDAPSIPAVYIGYTFPVILGIGMYSTGLLKNNPKTTAAGCAVLQASLLAFSENCILKAFTGRPNPDNFVYTKESNRSNIFKFGFLRNGVHYGWPSGHLEVTTAVVSSLSYFYFENKIIKATAWAAWSYMFLGVIAHEGNTMHWFSDAVAGSIMGFAIGSTVGKSFRRLYNNMENNKANSYYLQPQIYTGNLGFVFGCIF